jgi:hypothetical protein
VTLVGGKGASVIIKIMSTNGPQIETFGMLLILLLAAGAIWFIARLINNPQTRNLGVGILAGIGILLGFVLLTWTSERAEVRTPVASVDYRVRTDSGSPWQERSMRVEADGSVTQTYSVPTAVYEGGYGITNWARWSVIGLVIVAIIVASRSRPAAVVIAGVAVVAALGFVYAARSRQVALVPPIVVSPQPPPVHSPAPYPAPTHPSQSHPAVEETRKNDPGPQPPRLNKPDRAVEERTEAKTETISEAAKPADSTVVSAKSDHEHDVAEVVPNTTKPRPAWIDEPPSFSGGVYTVTVSSSRHASVDDCERELEGKVWNAVWNHAQKHIGPQAGYLFQNVSLAQQFVKDAYSERHESPLAGTMWQVHQRIKIDDADRRMLESRIRDYRVARRVEEMSGVGAAVLGSLAVAYCALRFGPRRKKPLEEPAVVA